MIYADALALAETAISGISDYSSSCIITGDIRRGTAEVPDIKIVCIPNRVPAVIDPRRDEAGEVVDPLFVAAAKAIGRVESGDPYSNLMVIIVQEKLRMFLYMPPVEDIYRMVAVTTGPLDFVNTVLQPAWKALGWVHTAKGLRKEEQCRFKGYEWKVAVEDPDMPEAWSSEEDFFTWAGLIYLTPETR